MKKIISLAIVLALVLSLSVSAFAAGEKGSITINGASEDNTYEIYRIMDLKGYDKTSGAYSYKADPAWIGFFATAEALTYVSVDADGYITWKAAEDDDTVAAFAKAALAWGKANSISPVKSTKNIGDWTEGINSDGKRTVKFSDLELGYYLIDSTMGALCGLTTTNPDASINAKNGSPTIDKQVEEDSTGNYGSTNTADIGQDVKFRVTINVHAGAQGYVLHDTMSAGLTFNTGSVKITHLIPGLDEHGVDASLFTVEQNPGDGCTFHVKFSQELCDKLETNDKLLVYYSATVNENAIVAGEGNSNTAKLQYGENHETTEDKTQTYTYGFDLVKTDSQNTLLDGAGFRIYDAATGGNEIKVKKQADGSYQQFQGAGEGDVIMVKDGKVWVDGLDNGTYYLEEVITPAGYNQLTSRQKFIIADSNLNAVFNDGIFSTGSGVHVVNKTGTMLPETGGMGTVLFITFGTMVVLATGVLLVTKKRMSMIRE